MRSVRVLLSLTLFVMLGVTLRPTPAPAEAAAPGACTVVTTTADSGPNSLRNAIDCASAGATITFGPLFSTPQTITLTSGALEITKTLVIDGPGADLLTISAGNASRLFSVSAATTGTLYGMTLRDGYASGHGGAIHVDGSLTLSDTVVISNGATGFGGGIYVSNGTGVLVVVDSVLRKNSSGQGGGFFALGPTTIRNTRILSNTSAAYSGGFQANGALVVEDSEIAYNSASNQGGGFYAASTALLSNTLISRNSSTSNGGGFYAVGALTLINSAVTTNTAGTAGGFQTDSTLAMTGTTVAGHTVSGGAGGFRAVGAAVIVDSAIEHNTSGTAAGGFYVGGAAWISDTRILSNTAGTWSGGFESNGALDLINSEVSYNRTGKSGGGFFAQNIVRLSGSRFTNNFAPDFGGGFFGSSATWITGSHFVGNAAGTHGGAVSNVGVLTVTNATFHDNAASDTGGAIRADNGIVIANATLVQNSATNSGGAIWVVQDSAFTNVTFYSNTAPTAASILISNTSASYRFFNTIIGGPDADQCTNAGSTITVVNSLSTDADCGMTTVADLGVGAFGDHGGGHDTVPLLAGSPAIDAGDAASCPATDQRGFSRIGVCDIGAFEFGHTVTPPPTPTPTPTPTSPTFRELMPRFGPPSGGISMTLLGNHFDNVTGLQIEGTNVSYKKISNTRINFDMPPGSAGVLADLTLVSSAGSLTTVDVFTYTAAQTHTLQAATGGVVTTTARVLTFTVPPQGTDGSMTLGYDPTIPPKLSPLDKVFAVVRLFAYYRNVPASAVLEAIYLQVKANPSSLGDEMRLALFRYVEGSAARGAEATGNWVLVPGVYDPTTGEFTAQVSEMGIYAVGAVNMRQYWLPMAPISD